MQAIDAKFYEKHREEFVRSCPGQWIAIHAGRLVGIWPTVAEAYDAAVRLTGSEDVFVHQAVPRHLEPIFRAPALTAGVLRSPTAITR